MNHADLDDKSLKDLQKNHMSFINHDPFRALSNHTSALPIFDIGKNFLYKEHLGNGDFSTTNNQSLLASRGDSLIHSSALLLPADPPKIKEVDLDKLRVERILRKYPLGETPSVEFPWEEHLLKGLERRV
jgi:hypothetical protein